MVGPSMKIEKVVKDEVSGARRLAPDDWLTARI